MEANFIKQIIVQYKRKLVFTYALVVIEKLGELSIPFFLGQSIDGLASHSYIPIILLASVYLTWVMIGTIRHRYDTKTYTTIYNQVVNKIVDNNPQQNTSKISAHINLTREIVDFMEFDMVYISTAVISIFVSMVMIFSYNVNIALLCLILIIPVSIISKKYGRNMASLNKKKNSELERQVDVISTKNKQDTKRHFDMLRLIQINISNKEATNYWQLQLVSLVILIGSLLIMSRGSLQIGVLVAMWSYLLNFINALEIVPYTIQKWTNLKDIISRIKK
jgi:ABC-type bacteriocin/lantibiotic exporter with double-glycine peptidase domain